MSRYLGPMYKKPDSMVSLFMKMAGNLAKENKETILQANMAPQSLRNIVSMENNLEKNKRLPCSSGLEKNK